MNLLDLLARPIAYHRCFVALGAGVTGAVMLSQAIYWARRTNDSDGWFYKSQAEWEEETGLKRSEQEKARKMLISIGVLDECRRGLPAKLYYRVNEDSLVSLLSGNLPTPTVEEVLSIFQTTLRGMSKTGHMRATKAGVRTEYVDYAEVLKNYGMTCSCCGKPITYGPGKKPMCLSFDHVQPIAKGGSHTADNLRPAHFGCNAAKCDHFEADFYDLDEADNYDYGNQTKSAYDKQTGSLKQSEQAGLHEAIILTENTTETTAEITTETTPNGEVGVSAPAVLPKQKRKKQDDNEDLGEPPAWLPIDAWVSFVEMRKAMGSRGKLTMNAARLIIKKLEELKALGHDPQLVLEQSVMNNWKGVFPIKGFNNGNRQQALEDRNRQAINDFVQG